MTRFQTEIQDQLSRIAAIANECKALQAADELFGTFDLSDVSYSSVRLDQDGKLNVFLYLKDDRKDSDIIKRLRRARLCGPFTGEQNWRQDALEYVSDSPMLRISVFGAVPATCKLETIETPLTEEELTAALARVSRVRTETKISCTDVNWEFLK